MPEGLARGVTLGVGAPLRQVCVVGESAGRVTFSHNTAGGEQEPPLHAAFWEHELSSALRQFVACKGIARVCLRGGALVRIARAVFDLVPEMLGAEDRDRSGLGLSRKQISVRQHRAALSGKWADVALARHCVGEPGGVPSTLAPFDSINRTEEQIITFVAHLCARLLESSTEIRSTILVQRAYRSFLKRTGREDVVERARDGAKERCALEAARYGRRLHAAVAHVSWGQGLAERSRAAARCGAAVRVQALVLERRDDPSFGEERAAAVCPRARAGSSAIRRELTLRWTAAVCLQAFLRAAAQRNRYLALRDTVVKLQAWWRGASAAAGYRRNIAAVGIFQARLRGAAVLARYWRLMAATVVVQSRRRGAVAATSYRRMRAAALTTQSARRGAIERRRLVLLADRATSIQAWWRMATAVALAREQRCSAVRLQAAWRGRSARTAYRRGVAGYIRLQAVWRGWSARTVYRRGVAGYVRLQAVVRGAGVRARLARERRQVAELEIHARVEAAAAAAAAAAQIQAWRLQAEAELLRAAAMALRIAAEVELQAFVRGDLSRRGFRAARSAATVLQAIARGRRVRAHKLR